MNDDVTLAPCPFCGAVVIAVVGTVQSGYWVVCDHCRCTGPMKMHGKSEAAAAWNAAPRAAAPALPAEAPAGYVRVRVAVAAKADGRWHARGSGDAESHSTKAPERATFAVQPSRSLYMPRVSWITADVPLPAPPPPPAVVVGVAFAPHELEVIA